MLHSSHSLHIHSRALQEHQTQSTIAIQTCMQINTTCTLKNNKHQVTYRWDGHIQRRLTWLRWGEICSSKLHLHDQRAALLEPADWSCAGGPDINTNTQINVYAGAVINTQGWWSPLIMHPLTFACRWQSVLNESCNWILVHMHSFIAVVYFVVVVNCGESLYNAWTYRRLAWIYIL